MHNYLFISGCGHSGTSLLTAMLGAHSRIYTIPFETNAFRSDPDNAKGKLELLARDCMKRDASYICEKTPRHVFKVDEIVTAFPNAKLLFIVRDPRDVVASYKRRGIRIEGGVRRWRKANLIVHKARARSNAFVVRYEDLIEFTDSILSQICEFLGVIFEPTMLEYWKDNREWFGVDTRIKPETVQGENHKIYRNWQIHQPLMKDKVHSYGSTLADEEILLVQHKLNDLATHFGYQLMPLDQSPI